MITTYPNLSPLSPPPPGSNFTIIGGVVQAASLHAPKCLVLLSRLPFFEVFKNCLGLIYTVYVENLQVSRSSLPNPIFLFL